MRLYYIIIAIQCNAVSEIQPRRKQLLATCKESPEVMQTEVHPYFQQPELLELCRQKNLKIQAFSPLAHGELGLPSAQKTCASSG